MDPLPMLVLKGKQNCSLEAPAGSIKTLFEQILDYPLDRDPHRRKNNPRTGQALIYKELMCGFVFKYIYLSTSQRSRNLFMAFFGLSNHWKEALSWHFTFLPGSSSKWRMKVWSSILSIRSTQSGENSFVFKLYATHKTSYFFQKLWKNSKQILFLKNWNLNEVLFSKRKYWGVGM